MPVPRRRRRVCTATFASATSESRMGVSAGVGTGLSRIGMATCSPVHTDSKPASSAATATRIANSGSAQGPRPAVLGAVRRIRARGLLTAAVTNNWITEDEGTGVLRPHFDAFVESAVAGVRKPDPRIYELACAALRVAPPEAVMLDDIGANLKTARALGMATIRVVDPDTPLLELEALLGFPLGPSSDSR